MFDVQIEGADDTAENQWRNEIMSIAGDALNGIGLWITRRERRQERR